MEDALSKINRITVIVDMEEDEAAINFYKTNDLIGSLPYQKLDLLSPNDAQLSVKAYSEYAKDVAINLIENGGLKGFYYEEKQKIDGIKYDLSKFRSSAKDYIEKILGDVRFVMTGSDTNNGTEYYNDTTIKNSVIDFGIEIGGTKLQIRCEIKSGQLCRPKTMIYDGEEHSFNITNVKHITRGR